MSKDGLTAEELHPCDCCGKPLCHQGLPIFWRVRLERMAVDRRAAEQHLGLTIMMRSPALASVFTGHQPIANPMFEKPQELLICEECAIGKPLPILVLAQTADEREERKTAKEAG